LTVKDYFFSRA